MTSTSPICCSNWKRFGLRWYFFSKLWLNFKSFLKGFLVWPLASTPIHQSIYTHFFFMLLFSRFSIWLRLLWVSDWSCVFWSFCFLLRLHTCTSKSQKRLCGGTKSGVTGFSLVSFGLKVHTYLFQVLLAQLFEFFSLILQQLQVTLLLPQLFWGVSLDFWKTAGPMKMPAFWK